MSALSDSADDRGDLAIKQAACLAHERGSNDSRPLSDVLDELSHVRVETPEAPPKAPRKLLHEYLGQRYGRLEIAQFLVIAKPQRVVAICSCGVFVYVRLASVLAGHTRSCGCLARDVARQRRRVPEGMRTRTMRAVESMVRRCRVRADYIAHGRTVAQVYLDNPSALRDEIGECPPGFTLDRIDNSRGYEPGNLRWASPRTQSRNRSNTHMVDLDGVRMPAIELCERHGVAPTTFYSRLARGWPALEAATLPAGSRHKPASEAA